jgi:hypothetical protein
MGHLDSANWEKYYPKDLIINPTPEILAANSATDKNNFTFVAPNLKTNSTYSFQFKYVFEDGGESTEWSPTYTVFTSNIAVLPKPKLTAANISYFQGILKVTWDGTDYNGTSYGNGFSRILIWVRDNTIPGQLFKIVGELSKPGTWSLAVPPKSQTVKLTAVSVNGEESAYSDEFTITPVVAAPVAVTSVTPAWSGTDFTISFTHNTSAVENEYLKEYLITLNTATSGTKVFSMPPVPGSSQKFSLSLERNQAAFGTAETTFSGTIQTLDIYGNKGTAVSFSNTAYASVLQTPAIVTAATTNGYTVSYTAQTSNTFKSISIEEVVSSSLTDPGTGYVGVATGATNPIFVPTTNTNKRWVRAKLFDTVNASTSYSVAVTVTPLSPVTVDNDGPPDVSSVTTSGGLDSSGTVGFNGYADISWPAVTTGGIRGYRIRYRPITTPSSSYSYADSPGSGTSYRLAGLGAGLVYEIAVATYDEYNNTSSNYIAGSNVTVGGTPYIASTVDVTGYFSAKANPTDAASTAFKFGYGVDTGKRGLVFNENNYWYIDSSQSALLKVGGATTNYIEWNGASFVIDGDLRAKKGSFSGNVSIASGASIYSGTLTGNTVTSTGDTGGSLNGAGYILNSSGLTFNSSTVNNVTTIDAATGNFITKSANIGGWLINSSTNPDQIYKVSGTNTIKLDSSNASIQADGTGYTAGFGIPDANNIVFWAGASRATAPFRVYKDGTIIATQLTIDGYATDLELSTGLNSKISTGGAASDVNSNTTTISGNKIRSGIVQSNNWNGTVTNGSDFSTDGMTIDLSTGAITSKKFRIDGSGNAAFKGTLDVGIAINSPVITGGEINIGNGQFVVTTAGAITAQSGTFSGNVVGGTFSLSGYQSTNYWTGGVFNAGSASTYVNVNASSGKFTAYSSSSTQDNVDGSGLTTINVPQLIEVNGSSIVIQGLAGVGNGLTAYGDLLGGGDGTPQVWITQYRSNGYVSAGNEPSANYGTAARYRMVVADPYDYNKLKRGFGVYYGVRNSVPTASTGLVGDVWISW